MKKLNLNDLKVESFVTSLEGKSSQTVKGGTSGPCIASVTVSIALSIAGSIIYSVAKKASVAICDTAAYCQTDEGMGQCTATQYQPAC